MKNRTFEEVLFSSYNVTDWYIDQFFCELFLNQQMFGMEDQLDPTFNTACMRGVLKCGYPGYHI